MEDTYIKYAEKACVVPFMRPLVQQHAGQKRRWIHGVQVEEDIELSYLDQHREGVSTVDYDERHNFLTSKLENGFKPDQISGTWMYGGILYDHFGHFLSESVHRLWSWKQCQEICQGIVFLTSGPRNLASFGQYVTDLFEIWNIDLSKIKIVREVSVVEKLYIPLPGGSIGVGQHSWYNDHLERLSVKETYFDSRYPEKILFSRKNFLTSGKIIGFGAIENLLSEEGYQIVCPENCTLLEQIKYIANAKDIVWEEGSNIHVLDILPQQALNAVVFKRRRHLKTFDSVLKGKVLSIKVFDLVKPLANTEVNLSKDIDSCRLDSNSVNRLSLCVICRVDIMRKFLNELLKCNFDISSNEYQKFIYTFLTAENSDISTYLSEMDENNNSVDHTIFDNHVRAQYTYIRVTDREANTAFCSPEKSDVAA